MHRLGMPVSADTILRQLKRDNPAAIEKTIFGSWALMIGAGGIPCGAARSWSISSVIRLSWMQLEWPAWAQCCRFQAQAWTRLKGRTELFFHEPGKPCCCDVHSLGHEHRIMYRRERAMASRLPCGGSSMGTRSNLANFCHCRYGLSYGHDEHFSTGPLEELRR